MIKYKEKALLKMESLRLNQIAACIFYGESHGDDGPLIVRFGTVKPCVVVLVADDVIDSQYGPTCIGGDTFDLIDDLGKDRIVISNSFVRVSTKNNFHFTLSRTSNVRRDITILYILAKQAEA